MSFATRCSLLAKVCGRSLLHTGSDALTLIAGIMKVRLRLFLLLVGTGKALRYISVVYVSAWTSP